MGEWTIHLDAPEGTSLEGTTEIAFKLLKDISGIEGVAHIEPSIGVTGPGSHDAHPLPVPGAAAWPAQEHAGADHRGDAAPALGVSGLTGRDHRANALGSGEGTGGFAIAANILGPDLEADRRLLEAGARGGAEADEPHGRKITLNISNPEMHVAVDRKRAADLGVRMATIGNTLRLAVAGDDEISLLQGRLRAVSGEDARARKPAGRHRGDRTADRAIGDRHGAHRQHRDHRARARAPRRCSGRIASSRSA